MRGAPDATYVGERQRPCEDYARKAAPRQKGGILRGHAPRLCRGVQFDRKVHLPQGHVLHDQRIDPRGDQLPGLTFGLPEFIVPQQRVERGMDPHAVAVGILHGPGDLFGRISRSLTRPEPRAAHVDGIGAVIHGSHRRGKIPRRSKQLDLSRRYLLHPETKIKLFPGFHPLSGQNHYL